MIEYGTRFDKMRNLEEMRTTTHGWGHPNQSKETNECEPVHEKMAPPDLRVEKTYAPSLYFSHSQSVLLNPLHFGHPL